MHAKVVDGLANIGKLVRSGDQPDIVWFTRDTLNVSTLALKPGRLGFRIGIRAAVDDTRHTSSEFSANLPQPWQAALILDGVMKQRGDRISSSPPYSMTMEVTFKRWPT